MHILYLIHGSARSNDALDFDILGAVDLRCKKKKKNTIRQINNKVLLWQVIG
jgi:hypothetical protein